MADKQSNGRKPDSPKISGWSFWAAVVTGVALVVAAMSGFGSKWDLWSFGFGFQLLRWGVYLALLGILFSAIGIVRTQPSTHRQGLVLSVISLVVAILVAGVPLSYYNTAKRVPPIHDITTDTDNPPQFQALRPIRRQAPNGSEYGGAKVANLQKQAYPDIGTFHAAVPPDSLFRTALQNAKNMGWQIILAETDSGRIEATDETFWYGFKDDIILRIQPAAQGSKLDIRSVSRVGRSDVGKNARRIRAYLKRLKTALAQT